MENYERAGEFVVTGAWTAQSARIFEEGRARRLVLNYALGFNEPNLDFLRGLPIRDLEILDRRVDTLEPIYSLAPTLESLNVTTHPDLAIRLNELPKLRDLGASWSQVRDSIGQVSGLHDLFLLAYTPDDLEPLSSHSGLQTLRIKIARDCGLCRACPASPRSSGWAFTSPRGLMTSLSSATVPRFGSLKWTGAKN